ncbi:phosphoglycerate mutase [Paucilactobacillus oligofermentans DSM 15707 = LMG 22743]|uniref:Phosphoglycerate mutase n=1 Tax=Paucilactobacillus oligofermentans DSM 15707 = LMG 22743 TaxID=1423778 RepID=A0A0R1RX43_9LACO|nr:histidine phosphatase family protein [Paucilactobacillus oligofermentans]KRL57736.1 phosphoglycerate mutase [Paucilactobacillus oligofermentans DSM 15707 = LMG 22743]CUS26816.1 Probable phosphoglycerate mutase GpmB3 [Paucilactobacillus oligofermentans DSM 15707 = LMG 22743]
MKHIFIVRHGKTEWNIDKRLQGSHADSPLLTDRRIDYQHLAKYLDQYQFSAVYSSPLNRAKETAEVVLSKMEYPVSSIQNDSRLTEISFGQWEGRRRSQLIRDYPALFDKLSNRIDDPALETLKIENFQEAGQRFANTVKQLIAIAPEDSNILIFSHGGISQLGIQTLTNNQQIMGLKNLSTSIIGQKGNRFYLDSYNQTGYLQVVDLDEGNVSI